MLETQPRLSSHQDKPRRKISQLPNFEQWPGVGFPEIRGGCDKDDEISQLLAQGEQDRMVSVREAANIFGITTRSVRRIIAAGHVKAEKRREKKVIEMDVEKVYLSLADLKEYRRTFGKYAPKK